MHSHARALLLAVVLVSGLAREVDAQVSFGPPVDYPAGTRPFSVALGDLNDDGKLDLVVTNHDSDNASVLLGNGDGTFGSATHFTAGNDVSGLALGDINGDGALDLLTANYGANSVSRRLGIGNGSFGARVDLPTPNFPRSIALGDLNGDSHLDLVTQGNAVSIRLGNGDGTFGSPTDAPGGSGGSLDRGLVIGDMNGDGKPDLAASWFGLVTVLLGNGDGSFTLVGSPTAGGLATSIAMEDLNGDGNQDLAVANHDNSTVSVLLGMGNGNFGAPTSFGTRPNPTSVAVGHLDDGPSLDLAVACGGSGGTNAEVSVLLGDGAGGFAPNVDFSTTSPPQSVAIGKVTGDVRPDIVVANGVVSVLVNLSPWLAVDLGRSLQGYELHRVLPNPSSAWAHIEFTVPREERIRLSVLDIQGRELGTLADRVFQPGRHRVTWDARSESAPSGLYFVRCETAVKTFTRPFVVTR